MNVLSPRDLTCTDKIDLNKRMEKTYNTSTSQKKSGMIILILDNVDIGVRNITRNKIPIYSNKGENL